MSIVYYFIAFMVFLYLFREEKKIFKYASYITAGEWDDYKVVLLGVYDTRELAQDAFYNFCASVEIERKKAEVSKPYEGNLEDIEEDIDDKGIEWYVKYQDLYAWNIGPDEKPRIEKIILNATIDATIDAN